MTWSKLHQNWTSRTETPLRDTHDQQSPAMDSKDWGEKDNPTATERYISCPLLKGWTFKLQIQCHAHLKVTSDTPVISILFLTRNNFAQCFYSIDILSKEQWFGVYYKKGPQPLSLKRKVLKQSFCYGQILRIQNSHHCTSRRSLREKKLESSYSLWIHNIVSWNIYSLS